MVLQIPLAFTEPTVWAGYYTFVPWTKNLNKSKLFLILRCHFCWLSLESQQANCIG